MGVGSGTSGITNDPAFAEDNVPGERQLEGFVPTTFKGFWPRMLKLDEDTEARLIDWLATEIEQAWTEREPLLKDWEQWQTDYWAKPSSTVKNFPFTKAANIVIPLTGIAAEAVHARLINTLFAVEPFWSVRPRTPRWIDAAPAIEKWLQIHAEDPESLDVYGFSNSSLMELVKLGTGVGKSGYVKDVRKTILTDENGNDQERWVEKKNSASLDYVPLANFLIRMGETDEQDAPWVGEEHTFSWGQLKRMSLTGRFDPDAIESIKHHWTTTRSEQFAGSGDAYHEKMDELTKEEPIWHEKFKTQEIWASFDVDGDGVDEEIVVDFHHASRTILAPRYNWYEDLHRPYRVGQYVPVEGRIFGLGIGKQNEQFQKEVTTIHRQRLDNATLANMRMMIVKKTAGFGPKEPVFPGKMWFVDDTNDIKDLQLSEVYPSAYANEESILRYSEKRTGVNEVLLGIAPSGTPGTATGDLARIEEGNKRFNAVLKNIRRWYGQLGQDVLANFQQFGNRQQHWLMLEDEGKWVEQILTIPTELVSRGAVIEVTATSSLTNQQVEQQNWLSLFQVTTNYYGQLLQWAQIIAELSGEPDILVQVAQSALGATQEAMKRLLDTFNVVGVDALLVNGGGNGEQGGNVAGALSPGQGTTGGPQGPNGSTGLEGLPAILAAISGGGAPGSPGSPIAGGGF